MCHRVLEITNPELKWKECRQHNVIYEVQMKYIENIPSAFTDDYVQSHQKMWDYQKSRDCSSSEGYCAGSLILSIFTFLGLLTIGSFKKGRNHEVIP